jgi:putative peptidoglycan lipid II flippase
MSHTASCLLIAGGIICIVLAIFAPNILFLLFPTFEHSARADEFILLTRILLAQPIFLGLSGILTSVTQINRRFALFALSPVLYNVGIIFGSVVLYPVYGLSGIGIGVLMGAFLHMAIHIPVVAAAGLLPKPTIPSPALIWSVAKSSIPRSLALGMGSIITLLLISLASRTSSGGVAVYTLASNLAAVPLSLIGASYATAAFPVLAEHMSEKRYAEFKETLVTAARHIIFWSSVITVLTIVLRAYIVRIILGTGAFDWNDTRLTAAVLAILVAGLMAQGIILLCARAFYAAQRSWNPLWVQLADCGISVLAAWGLVKIASTYPEVRYFVESLFRVGDVPGTSVLFIALGAVLGQVIMGVVALMTLRTVAKDVAGKLVRPMFEGFAAAILGGSAAYGVLSFMGNIASLSSLPTVFLEGTIAGMVGLAVAAAVLALLENQEFRDLVESLRRLTSAKALQPHGALLDDRPDS